MAPSAIGGSGWGRRSSFRAPPPWSPGRAVASAGRLPWPWLGPALGFWPSTSTSPRPRTRRRPAAPPAWTPSRTSAMWPTGPRSPPSRRGCTHDRGPLGVLVNNAGVGMSGPFTDMSAGDWEWIRSINLDGVLNGCRAFVPTMLDAGRGHVVNLSSVLGYLPSAMTPAYCTTKAAVLMFTLFGPGRLGPARRRRLGYLPRVDQHADHPADPIRWRRGHRRRGRGARSEAQRGFSRGHSPDLVARAVLDAIRRDRAVVPVGAEASAAWWLTRLPAGRRPVATRGRAGRDRAAAGTPPAPAGLIAGGLIAGESESSGQGSTIGAGAGAMAGAAHPRLGPRPRRPCRASTILSAPARARPPDETPPAPPTLPPAPHLRPPPPPTRRRSCHPPPAPGDRCRCATCPAGRSSARPPAPAGAGRPRAACRR